MGKKFVYNAGKADLAKDEVVMKFGLFFDGTLNSKENTRIREVVQAEEAKEWEKEVYKKHGGTADDDISFQNDYTNVARLQMSCNEDYAIYIEGIGTEAIPEDIESQEREKQKKTIDGLGDKNKGYAMGSGSTGIRAKVRRGCELLIAEIKKSKDESKGEEQAFNSLTLDVFGFSRGAAAARNFVYEVNSTRKRSIDVAVKHSVLHPVNYEQFSSVSSYEIILVDRDGKQVEEEYLDKGQMPRMGYLGYLLLKNGILSKEELNGFILTIRFIGLYDTVSSYEDVYNSELIFVGTAISHLAKNQFQDDVEQLQLNNLGNFQKAVHFTAQDEHRENFDLTRMIKHPGVSSEYNFPGVHCDIGGAYLTGIERKTSIENSTYRIKIEARIKELISEYWFKEDQIKLMQQRYSDVSVITGTRYLGKEYSYIPLHFMERMFREVLADEAEDVLLKSLVKTYPLKKRATILNETLSMYNSAFRTEMVDDTLLINVKDCLSSYVFGGAKEWKFVSDEELLNRESRNKYVEGSNQKASEAAENPHIWDKHTWDMFGELNQEEIAEVNDDNKNKIEEVLVTRYDPQSLLRKLRNEYLHWSARRNGLGMDPRNDYVRVEH